MRVNEAPLHPFLIAVPAVPITINYSQPLPLVVLLATLLAAAAGLAISASSPSNTVPHPTQLGNSPGTLSVHAMCLCQL